MRRRRYANSYRPAGGTFSQKPGGGPPWIVWLGIIPVIIVVVLLARAFLTGGDGEPELVSSDPEGAQALGACESAACASTTPRPTPVAIALPTQTPSATPRAALPPHTGAAVVILEEGCGAILYQSNASARLSPASLTKIMTALVTVDHVDLDEVVTVTVDGPALSLATDSTVMGIEPGQMFSVRDLLYGLLLPSGNDAAVQLAEYVAGSQEDFVEMMNEKATALGLRNTHFANPHGLDDPDLYTSASDMAILGRHLLLNPDLAEIVPDSDSPTGVERPASAEPQPAPRRIRGCRRSEDRLHGHRAPDDGRCCRRRRTSGSRGHPAKRRHLLGGPEAPRLGIREHAGCLRGCSGSGRIDALSRA